MENEADACSSTLHMYLVSTSKDFWLLRHKLCCMIWALYRVLSTRGQWLELPCKAIIGEIFHLPHPPEQL